jgi:KipI family sensor histidine kinase inhibitor
MNPIIKPFQIHPVGDSAVLIQLGNQIDLEINSIVHAFAQVLMKNAPQGIGEAVPAYTTVLLHYDPLCLSYNVVKNWIDDCYVRLTKNTNRKENLIKIPTVYGETFGPDLEDVARLNNLSVSEVIRLHSAVEYPVYMMGFTPGFPYLGGMDARLSTPRLETPRKEVPAGSVGIAGSQTGIYSITSPGGWRIIGCTPLVLFDPQRESPFLINPGDRLRFVPVSAQEAGL